MLQHVSRFSLPPGVFLKKTGLTVPKEVLSELKSKAISLPEGNIGLRSLHEATELKGVQVAITRNEVGGLFNIDVFRKSEDGSKHLLRMPADLSKENLIRALSLATKEVKRLDLNV